MAVAVGMTGFRSANLIKPREELAVTEHLAAMALR